MRPLPHSRPRTGHSAKDGRGFTLIELLITLVVLAVVMIVLTTVMYTAARSKAATSNHLESTQAARAAMDMMARDLRSAGYGADLTITGVTAQPPIAYIDSMQVLINEDLNLPAPASDVQAPRAYDPAGSPKPFPLNGTAWTPPVKYRTGAEIVRWTLDVNNDGVVDASDVASPDGVDARRTPNPNDYVLVREVYGDSAYSAAAGNNSGEIERVGLIRKPGSGGTPAMFQVYLRGMPTPWDWSLGPVPQAKLADIERIEVSLVATSAHADWRGRYADTKLRTQVNSLRNTPDFGQKEYPVDGYVYNDLNTNGNQDAGEPGIPDAWVRLGPTYVNTTDATGHFLIRAPAGVYTLRHTPPPGYQSNDVPDTFVVTLGPGTSQSFADIAVPGGRVHAYAYQDLNGNGTWDSGEPGKYGTKMTLTPGPDTKYTDGSGATNLFAPVGSYSVACTPPDSFVVSGTNPQTGSMVNGDSAFVYFPLVVQTAKATVQGKVFRDNNRNGVLDAGEAGIEKVWVGVQLSDGATTLGYAYTDANGDYSIDVPPNQPPGTQNYFVTCIIPPGYYPTSSTTQGPLLLADTDVSTGHNFGVAGYTVITLNASRVLSLASADLIEKDWSGSDAQWDTKGDKDADIVLGADAGGTDNISVWFNQYSAAPVFDPSPTYTRNAPQSVLSLALGDLDSGVPPQRPDVVTGTRNTAAGNFFVWINQNSGGNLGYLPSTFSPGGNYRTNDGGDVTSVLLHDCAGGTYPDLIVGTKSPTAGRGYFEVWQNEEGAAPVFTRQEIYPPAGSIPSGTMGEVAAMALADFDGDGMKDLVVGTRTSNYSGELIFFKGVGRVNGARFVQQLSVVLSGDAVTALTVLDVDGDGKLDVVVGTQDQFNGGRLLYFRNQTSFVFDFPEMKEIDAPGIVMSLANTDLGGSPRSDIIMGWRQDETSYVGGLRVYFTDLGTLPSGGTDPSAGAIGYMVPAITVNNFNYGVQPPPPGPYLTDVAVGVKITSTTGALVVFIR